MKIFAAAAQSLAVCIIGTSIVNTSNTIMMKLTLQLCNGSKASDVK
jgi:hypothetical protein